MMAASRLAREAAAKKARKPPPTAGNYFVDFLGTGFLGNGFVIGPFTTGHSEAPSRDTVEGSLSVWAVMPPRSAGRRRRGPTTEMARATVSITIIAAINVITDIVLIGRYLDLYVITILTATAGSTPWASGSGTTRTRKSRPRMA